MSSELKNEENLPNNGKPHYAYYCNTECEFFPCHTVSDPKFFNCLFCYCPLYALGDKCGGNFKYIEGGIKDCSNCTLPHSPAGYAYVTKKYPEIMEIAKRD
ncbi:MAG: cysteine-rich small domain-containing protein [Christensenellaceae bacterium]|nr:cysteine-rich small domain-containing protein [Christensenellaceae bacterium]